LHKIDNIDGPLLWEIDESEKREGRNFYRCRPMQLQREIPEQLPCLKRGVFFEAFQKNRAQYITIRAGLKDCPAYWSGKG